MKNLLYPPCTISQLKKCLKKEDTKLIRSFCKDQGMIILDFPDCRNRVSKDIDAIAQKNGINYAIEHTSFNSLKDQKEKSSYFKQMIEGIEDKYQNLNYRLNIIIEWNSIKSEKEIKEKKLKKKYNVSKINSSLINWIDEESLKDCFTSDKYPYKTHRIKNYNNLPFDFLISKVVRTQLQKGVFISRSISENNDEEFSKMFNESDELSDLISKKITKLKQEKYNGYQTILILESEDIALMHYGRLKEEVDKYFSRKSEFIDQIWYCDTAVNHSARPEFQLIKN